MKQFEGKSLEEVYAQASNEFNCSITELDIDIVQQPSKGFLGIGKKGAIIIATPKRNRKRDFNKSKEHNRFKKKDIKIEDFSKRIEDSNRKDEKRAEDKRKKDDRFKSVPKVESKEQIFDNFYSEAEEKRTISKIIVKKDKEQIVNEVNEGLISLFKDTCYGIDNIKVEFFDEETLYIEFTGEDSALLIGKEGYRYKALSYILFNWINEKYGLMLRLEVAEFLKNQETAIHTYLGPVIETIKDKGSFKTKPLDGILVHIALKKLRDEFPDKYVAVKTNIKGDKYVLVNEYRSKEQ
ncbi:hypothetical protein CRV08_03235 [Halarcobacter ebronensis]|uniref:RNA-binding protein KhpB N-terminal domain-containing protein n=1 Tax=Halarcobacter ebronensis TaxID=1462615 RepID=A0A4Q0YGJ7_9BACT|nr:Jag N-terminal domain-containing protein [Halarcobacter ebronensis]QKF82751.1 Jag domain-containing protein [Halarcobacter ebronensis]RXJ69732.1 hypothetical protein CRV08_03235 [Halarcobacter ebronensis]RXK06776.1 hypothetical protein CRV07_04925 [Halarcobacter ebronensis]